MTTPPAPTWPLVLARWSIEPGVVALVVVAAVVYLRRRGARPLRSGHAGRPGLFGAGLAVVALALLSPVATYAEALLAVHMVQHLLLVLVAAPLLVAALPPPRNRLLRNPLFTWTVFAAAGWVVHFSPLFDLSLRHAPVHGFEHALFLGSGLLFWAPVLDAGDGGLSYPARLLYVALAMPQNTFLALAIFSADHPLYPTYRRLAAVRAWGPSPLADQRLGGGIMWVAGDVTLLIAVLLIAARWAASAAGDELDLNAAPEPVDQYKHGDNAP